MQVRGAGAGSLARVPIHRVEVFIPHADEPFLSNAGVMSSVFRTARVPRMDSFRPPPLPADWWRQTMCGAGEAEHRDVFHRFAAVQEVNNQVESIPTHYDNRRVQAVFQKKVLTRSTLRSTYFLCRAERAAGTVRVRSGIPTGTGIVGCQCSGGVSFTERIMVSPKMQETTCRPTP